MIVEKKKKTQAKNAKAGHKTPGASKKKVGASALVFSGDLTLRTATEVKKNVTKVLASSATIQVSFKDVSDVDLSFVQIICAAHRSAVTDGKKIEFPVQWPEAFVNLTKESGLNGHVGCSSDGHILCPWLINNTQ